MSAEGSSDTEELRADHFADRSLSVMRSLWQEKSLCDFVIVINSTELHVHRLVLAACSDYFKALFAADMRESSEQRMTMHDMSLPGFTNFLSFAYSGHLNLRQEHIEDTVQVCSFLQAHSALEVCLRFLKTRMTFENATDILRLADVYSLTSLEQHFRSLILSDFDGYSRTPHFFSLDAASLCSLLDEDRLRARSEAAVFGAAFRWCQAAPQRWAHHGLQVFKRVRFTLDGVDLVHFVRTLPQFRHPPLRQLVEDAHALMYRPEVKYLNQSPRTRVRAERRTLVQFGGVHEFSYDYDDLPRWAELNGYVGQRAGTTENHLFTPSCKSWMPLGAAGRTKNGRSHCVFLEVNGYALLIGGFVYQFGETSLRHQPTAEVQLFSPADFSLWPLMSMSQERAEHDAVRLGDFVYVVGGRSDTPLASVERYDMKQNFWHAVAPLPLSLYSHSATTFEDSVVVCGGYQDGGDVLNSVYQYSPVCNQWQEMCPMLVARAGHAAAALEGRLIVCGGRMRCDTLRCLTSVENYDPRSGQWSYLEPMRFECAFATPVVLDGDLLLVGGENSVNDLMISIQRYRLKANEWGMYAVLPKPMNCVGCCALKIDLEKPSNPNQRCELLKQELSDLKKELGYHPGHRGASRYNRNRSKSARY